ncbi:MAG: hypothetical protein JWR11_1574 [Mycobacterium sp.]|nr:hypothetical protein [Mycobacterium sp.]
MVGLGLAVGSGSTRLDDWFIDVGWTHPSLGRLLFFTDPRLLVALLVIALAVALGRRRPGLAAIVVVTPVLGIVCARLLKRLFDRQREGALAYPSGHVTTTVVVLGMVLLVAGVTIWLLVAATVVALLGLLGQAFTYHYFTDTVGATFLGTALVCIAFLVAKLDRCQPRCDLDHSGG